MRQDRQCTYNVTLWRVRVLLLPRKATARSLCIVQVHVTVTNTKTLEVLLANATTRCICVLEPRR
jgi:hypothetical protein